MKKKAETVGIKTQKPWEVAEHSGYMQDLEPESLG